MSVGKSSSGKNVSSEKKVFQQQLTILEQQQLVSEINDFTKRRKPRLIKYRLDQLVEAIRKNLNAFDKQNLALIKKYGDGHVIKSVVNGAVNPKYLEYRKEIEPLEQAKDEVIFDQFPLSHIINVDEEEDGNYPLLNKLFYVDDLAIKLMEKQMQVKGKDLEAHVQAKPEEELK